MTPFIGPAQTKPGSFEAFSQMLHESAQLAQAESRVDWAGSRKSSGKGRRDGSWGPWDGIYLPSAHSFWYGIVHDTPDAVVFCPTGRNILRYKYNPEISESVRIENYEAVNYTEGFAKPRENSAYRYQVLFRSHLGSPLLHRPSFYSLECWNCQREWLAAFMRKALADVVKFMVQANS